MKDSDTRADARLTYRTPEVNSLGTITDITAAGHGGNLDSQLGYSSQSTQSPRGFVRRYQYRHYGLTLGVNQDLPRLARADSQVPDISIDFLEPGQLPPAEVPWVMLHPPAAIWRYETDAGSWLRLRYAVEEVWAEFVVDGHGETVWVSRSENVLLSEVTELLLGPVFSCVAAQRGLTCLHASVVRLDGRVIAVLGPSGAGKSTTALALVQAGDGALVSDDVAVLSEQDQRLMVASGAPRMRMRPDPAISLLGRFDSLQPIWAEGRPTEPKRYLAMEGSDAIADESKFPLDAMYFLLPWTDTVTEPAVQPLTPATALAKLMGHRHMAQALDVSSDRRDFARLAQLARTVPARELIRPTGLETTGQTVASIVSDVRSLA